MYKGYTVSVVMPAYNEEEGIVRTVKDFGQPYVDEVIVVDNNCTDRTAALAKKAGAHVVKETRQGYGFAIQKGLHEARGDLVIVTESDSTFVGRDMEKLLAYVNDADMVLGTRLNKQFIQSGAKMNWLLYWGNLFLAKLIELRFFGRVQLTDVGCTMRVIKKKQLRKIEKQLSVGGSHFSPHMIVVALKSGMRVVEVPVNYRVRLGQSKITSTKMKSIKLGLRMLRLIVTP